MAPFVEVTFHQLDHDRSLEGTVHRWVARLLGTELDVRGARVRLERTGRKRVGACLELALTGGQSTIAVTEHVDAYVAIADAFRAARQQVMARLAPATRRAAGTRRSWFPGEAAQALGEAR